MVLDDLFTENDLNNMRRGKNQDSNNKSREPNGKNQIKLYIQKTQKIAELYVVKYGC